jgi:pilus assembly protein CpaB
MKAARVIVLSVALAAGGIAAMLAGHSGKRVPAKQVSAANVDTVDVLVARSDISTGETITPQDVRWQAWPASASTGNFIRKNNRPNAIDNLKGLIVRVPFVAGEPIRETKLVDAKGSGFMAAILPSGMRAVSTQISPETGAGGFILPNDHVDVILTRRKAAGNDVPSSETILSNVRVLAIDQTIKEKNGQKDVIGKTATLELTPKQAETLTLAQHLGTLSLALRSITDARRDDPKVAGDLAQDGHHGINVVRFGVSTPSAAQ